MRRMLVVGCLVASILSAGLVSWVVSSANASQPQKGLRVVEANRFVVRNPDGTIAAEFGLLSEEPSKGYPGVRLFDKGNPIAELTVVSSQEKGFENEDATLIVRAVKGSEFLKVNTGDIGYGYMTIFDGREQSRIQFSSVAKDEPPHMVPSIMLFDAKGDTVLNLPAVKTVKRDPQ